MSHTGTAPRLAAKARHMDPPTTPVGTPITMPATARAVACQATTMALIGIIISVVPIWLVGALVASVVVVANLLAIGPALVATRSKPASLLRAPQQNAV
jgi:hypothetical protein